MTYTEIVTEVAERLNLTSVVALARIGRSVNERYRWVCSSLGLQTSVITTVTASTVVSDQTVTFAADKILAVYDSAYSPPRVLTEVTVSELRNGPLGTDPARYYAIYQMGDGTVTIRLDSIPATIYALGADVLVSQSTLVGANTPNFTTLYHDILIYGAMATEVDKMEKPDLAEKYEAKYQYRLSELRLYIAKSAYLLLYPGKTGGL